MAMLRNSMPSIRKTVGQELLRIEGVYMYLITNECNVGVFLGHKCLRLCTWDCPLDENPVRAYLICNKWVYPLARSFSPVHISETNSLIMPDPFSKFERPVFVGFKLPISMSMDDKRKLENYLDVFGHLKGSFSFYKDVLPGSDDDEPLFDAQTCRRTWSIIDLTMDDVDNLEDIWYAKHENEYASFSQVDLRLFRCNNLNLKRLYVTGPKDDNHIHISTVPAGIKISQLLYAAIGFVYKRQKLWRKFKEYRGEASNFDQRLLSHEKYYRDEYQLYDQTGQFVDNIVKAGKVLDLKIKYIDFELLDYEINDVALPKLFLNLELEGALITRKVFTQFETLRFQFHRMQTLSQIEIDRETKTILVPRIPEHCDHHKPTEILLRPVKPKIFGIRTY